MVFDILSTAGKWSTILLALEALVLSLLPLFILYKVVQGLYRFVPKVAPALRNAHQTMLKIANSIEHIMALIAAPFIWASSFMARVRAHAVGLRRILQGR